MVTQAYNPSIREIKVERFQIQGHLGIINSQTQSQKARHGSSHLYSQH